MFSMFYSITHFFDLSRGFLKIFSVSNIKPYLKADKIRFDTENPFCLLLNKVGLISELVAAELHPKR